MPVDPSADGAYFVDVTDYGTGYNLLRNATTGRITVSATGEVEAVIEVTR